MRRAGIALAAAALVSCSSSVRVVRRADPYPFGRGTCKVLVSPLGGALPPTERAAFAESYASAIVPALGSALGVTSSVAPDANAFWLQVDVPAWDPGDPVGGTAHAKVDLRILDASRATTLDEVEMDLTGKGGGISQRAEQVGTKAAKAVAKYVRHRVGCADYHSSDFGGAYSGE